MLPGRARGPVLVRTVAAGGPGESAAMVGVVAGLVLGLPMGVVGVFAGLSMFLFGSPTIRSAPPSTAEEHLAPFGGAPPEQHDGPADVGANVRGDGGREGRVVDFVENHSDAPLRVLGCACVGWTPPRCCPPGSR
jgi:hypothetical protein